MGREPPVSCILSPVFLTPRQGLIAAQIYYAYIKSELADAKLI